MRTIGLLGGMGWASTAVYYRLFNEAIAARLGAPHSAKLLIHSFDFAEIVALQQAGRWDKAAQCLTDAAKGLVAAGAEAILIGTNTMHRVASQVAGAIDVPLLHVCDAVANAAAEANCTRVGLLGTAYTMEQDFYRDRLASGDLEVIIPDEADRAAVHRIIFDELVNNVVTEPSREIYRAVIGRLVDAGAQGIILGCTEIELLVGEQDSPVPLFPTTALHVASALDFALPEPQISYKPTNPPTNT